MTDSREDTVTYAEEADERVGRSPARVILGVILVIIGILLIIASILYFTQPAHSLPGILGTLKQGPHVSANRANSHRTLRGVVTLVVALVCFGAGVFAFMWKGKDRN